VRKLSGRGVIALMLVGIVSGCNLTAPPPPSRLLQVGREKPKVQQPKPSTREPISSTVNNRNLLLGNPSNAASSVASTDNYLMVKPQYVLSYNNKTHTANWVSWQLNKSWIGTADRKNDFRPDDALPNQGYFILVE
jgi:endonuclease G